MLDDVPGPRERSPRAQAFWQGKIIYIFLVMIVIIPAQDMIRSYRRKTREENEAKAKAAAALSPQVREDERACERNDAKACRRAGRAYSLGVGAPSSRARADALYEKACALGERESCLGGSDP